MPIWQKLTSFKPFAPWNCGVKPNLGSQLPVDSSTKMGHATEEVTLKMFLHLGTIVHAFNPRIWKAIYEFKASLFCIVNSKSDSAIQ